MVIQKKILLSFLHGLLLVGFILLWLHFGWFTEEDKIELRWAELVRRELLNIDPKPKEAYTFVDVSGAKALLQDDATEDKFVITDRVILARFLNLLNEYEVGYKYILCDIYFDDKSKQDDSLATAFLHTKRLVVAAHRDESGEVIKPVFDVNYGLVDYFAEDGCFLKMEMYNNDTLLSLPLVMYRELYKPFIKKGVFLDINKEIYLNSQTISLRIRPYDYEIARNFGLFSLVKLMKATKVPSAFREFFGDKIVVIGDFKGDMHETVIGDMPGSLVLVNSLLSLEYKDNRITAGWVIFIIGTMSLSSFMVFFAEFRIKRSIGRSFREFANVKYIKRFLEYATWFYLIALMSYLIFHVFVNILILTLYFSFLKEWVVKKFIAKL